MQAHTLYRHNHLMLLGGFSLYRAVHSESILSLCFCPSLSCSFFHVVHFIARTFDAKLIIFLFIGFLEKQLISSTLHEVSQLMPVKIFKHDNKIECILIYMYVVTLFSPRPDSSLTRFHSILIILHLLFNFQNINSIHSALLSSLFIYAHTHTNDHIRSHIMFIIQILHAHVIFEKWLCFRFSFTFGILFCHNKKKYVIYFLWKDLKTNHKYYYYDYYWNVFMRVCMCTVVFTNHLHSILARFFSSFSRCFLYSFTL